MKKSSKKRPLIGLTLDWEKQGTFSKRPYYALRENYFSAVYAAGGLPIALPYLKKALPDYLALVDGIIVPGGNFALDKKWYVASEESFPYKPTPRLENDVAVIKETLKQDIPLLGICAGMQIMGGIMGGKMTRNVHSYIETPIDHLNETPAEEYAHEVRLKAKTLLHKIIGKEKIKVNTAHTEALVELPRSVQVNAVASDGVIEGIELPSKRFAIGVQWHPEFFARSGAADFILLKAFIEAATKRKRR